MMRIPSPRILPLLMALCAPSLCLAQDLSVGGSAHLPTSNISSDHPVTAINDEGDIFVVWQEVFAPGRHEVWGAFFDYQCDGTWARPSQHMRIGAADVLVGAAQPTCKKADVVAAGNDFLVVWTIYDRQTPTNKGHLQAAKIDANGVLHQAAAGEGYRVSDDFWVGDSGATLSLADWRIAADGTTQQGHGLAVYIEHISRTAVVDGNINHYRMRGVQIDFSASTPTWTHVKNPHGDPWLADGLAGDALHSSGTSARVPPSVLQDRQGDLIVAVEEFKHKLRGAAQHRGHLWMLRYSVDGSGVASETARLQIQGAVRSDFQRRPHLALAALGTDNRIGVSWLELDAHGENGRANSALLEVQVGGFLLNSQSAYDGQGTHEVLDSRTSPTLEYVIGVHAPLPGHAGKHELFAWAPGMASPTPILQNVAVPRRPGWDALPDLPCTPAIDPVYTRVIDDGVDVYLDIAD